MEQLLEAHPQAQDFLAEPAVDRDDFEVVAESFLARFRAGQRPSIDDLAARHPELADQIRELLPALVMVEKDLTIDHDPGSSGPQAPPAPAPGVERRLGDYRILREIGRGGMGVVYEAEQVSLGRQVALKVLPGQVAADRLALERFRREAKAAARLHHTNIVPVFEVGQRRRGGLLRDAVHRGPGARQGHRRAGAAPRSRAEAGRGGMAPGRPRPPRRPVRGSPRRRRVAESLLNGRFATEGAGPSTDMQPAAATGPAATEPFDSGCEPPRRISPSRIRTGRARPRPPPAGPRPCCRAAVRSRRSHLSGRRAPFFRSVAQIGRQAAQGLAYAHASGIVHRDIKPSNLLLDHAGVVWIADFGLAKGEDEGLTHTGDILGTLRYMAPERFRGEGDARADVYALGLTLYELLTLRPGFDSSDRLKLIEQIKTEEPLRPRSIDARIPRDLETIVLKAIEKDPKARYQSAEAMAEDLRRFLADEPIRARQVSAAERYWRWARRNPVIAVLGGVLDGGAGRGDGRLDAGGFVLPESCRSESAAKAASQAHRGQALAERDHSRQQSADLTLDKGFALAQEGHADRGLLWMLEALKTAPDDAEEFRRTVRWNLGAWLGQVHKPLRIFDTGPCNHLAFSPDGRSFATSYIPHDRANATPIDLWDTASGRKLSSLPGAFAPFAFRPDGKVLVGIADDRRRMVAIDLATGRVLWTTADLPGEYRGGDSLQSRRFHGSCDRDYGSDGTWLLRLDAATGQQRGEPMRGQGCMAVAPDGRTVATGRIENGEAYIDVLDLPSGRRTGILASRRGKQPDLVFSPDGKSLFGSVLEVAGDGSNGTRLRSDLGPGHRKTDQSAHGEARHGAIYTPAGDRLLTQRRFQAAVRDAATGRERGSRFLPEVAHCLASGRSYRADSASDESTVRLWQVSADAEPLADGGTDKKATPTGSVANRRWRGFNAFRSGRLRADGQIAVSLAEGAGGQELIRLSDPATGRPLGRPAPHYPGWIVRAVAFSPDGRCFATGSNPETRYAGELRLWDASTGRLLVPADAAHQLGRGTGIPARRQGPGRGRLRWTRPVLGYLHRQGNRPAASSRRDRPEPGLQPGRQDARGGSRQREYGQARHPALGYQDTPTHRRITAQHGRMSPESNSGRMVEPCSRVTRSLAPGCGTRPEGRRSVSQSIDEAAGGFRPDGRAFLTLGKDGTVKLRDAATGEVLARLLTSSSPAICAAFRGDGGLVAAGFEDGAVRLCDPATAQPVGPPRFMRHAVHQVAFTADGRTVAAIDEFGESRTWPVPEPLQDSSLDDLTLRIEARTGLRMETGLAISRLDGPAWRERLEQLGRLDPAALARIIQTSPNKETSADV